MPDAGSSYRSPDTSDKDRPPPDPLGENVEEPNSSEPRTREEGSAEPRWITRPMLDAMHADLVRTYGGLPGVNADGLISLALARPRDRWATKEQRPDLADLASTYVYALSKNAGYRDCNLHVAFMAMNVFLDLNGRRLEVEPDAQIPKLIRGVASNGPETLASWIRERWKKR
ncbi:type II toxin-antitoxin system death-on-curing family toxin [Longibacter salinarum]|nr:Fic family protein [Longibacter salinarum]